MIDRVVVKKEVFEVNGPASAQSSLRFFFEKQFDPARLKQILLRNFEAVEFSGPKKIYIDQLVVELDDLRASDIGEDFYRLFEKALANALQKAARRYSAPKAGQNHLARLRSDWFFQAQWALRYGVMPWQETSGKISLAEVVLRAVEENPRALSEWLSSATGLPSIFRRIAFRLDAAQFVFFVEKIFPQKAKFALTAFEALKKEAHDTGKLRESLLALMVEGLPPAAENVAQLPYDEPTQWELALRKRLRERPGKRGDLEETAESAPDKSQNEVLVFVHYLRIGHFDPGTETSPQALAEKLLLQQAQALRNALIALAEASPQALARLPLRFPPKLSAQMLSLLPVGTQARLAREWAVARDKSLREGARAIAAAMPLLFPEEIAEEMPAESAAWLHWARHGEVPWWSALSESQAEQRVDIDALTQVLLRKAPEWIRRTLPLQERFAARLSENASPETQIALLDLLPVSTARFEQTWRALAELVFREELYALPPPFDREVLRRALFQQAAAVLFDQDGDTPAAFARAAGRWLETVAKATGISGQTLLDILERKTRRMPRALAKGKPVEALREVFGALRRTILVATPRSLANVIRPDAPEAAAARALVVFFQKGPQAEGAPGSTTATLRIFRQLADRNPPLLRNLLEKALVDRAMRRRMVALDNSAALRSVGRILGHEVLWPYVSARSPLWVLLEKALPAASWERWKKRLPEEYLRLTVFKKKDKIFLQIVLRMAAQQRAKAKGESLFESLRAFLDALPRRGGARELQLRASLLRLLSAQRRPTVPAPPDSSAIATTQAQGDESGQPARRRKFSRRAMLAEALVLEGALALAPPLKALAGIAYKDTLRWLMGAAASAPALAQMRPAAAAAAWMPLLLPQIRAAISPKNTAVPTLMRQALRGYSGNPWLDALYRELQRALGQSAAPKSPAANAPRRPTMPVPKVSPPMLADEGIFFRFAGLVILHPFIPTFLSRIGLDPKEEEQAIRAAQILQYVATGRLTNDEEDMPLVKLLCGLPFETPIPPTLELSEPERNLADKLILGAIRNWPAMQNASPMNFRATFLIRPGRLARPEGIWKLTVMRSDFDLLLMTLPWGLSHVKYSWMPDPLTIEWKIN